MERNLWEEELTQLELPPALEKLDLARLQGTLLVVGANDTGKTTLARSLYRRLAGESAPVYFLDGDPGQSSLGPPATLTLANSLELGQEEGLPSERVRRYFVGSTSPYGHMLAVLVGASLLSRAAYQSGAKCLVYDTSGLIHADQGGLALKLALIDLLQPELVVGIQREMELEALLVPLRRSRRVRVVSLRPSLAVRRRDPGKRQAHRREQFARYFAGSGSLVFNWREHAIFPLPRFSLNRLVALEDAQRFTLGLGIVTNIERDAHQVELLTPLRSLQPVNAIQLGDLAVDPQTFQDRMLFGWVDQSGKET